MICNFGITPPGYCPTNTQPHSWPLSCRWWTFRAKHGNYTIWRVWRHVQYPFFFFFFFFFLSLQHTKVPRLGVKSELQLPAYTTATQNSSCILDLYHISGQRQIPDSLSKARDQIRVLTDLSQIRFLYATKGTPRILFSWFQKLFKNFYPSFF